MLGALCSSWEDILIGRERSSLTDFYFKFKLKKQTVLYVADPASFLASNSVLGALFSSEKITVYSVTNISEFVLLPHPYCKYYNF